MSRLHPVHLAPVVALLLLAGCDRAEPVASGPAGAEPDDAPPSARTSPTATGPRLAEGLWVVTSRSEDLTSEVRMCLDADVQERMNVLSSQNAGGACQESTVAPARGGGWTVRSVCDMGPGGRVVSEGTVTGDFRTAYVNRMTSTITGAAVPHMNRTTEQVAEGRREGPCPDGMAPGDMIAPGGIRLNMLEMAEMAEAMGGRP